MPLDDVPTYFTGTHFSAAPAPYPLPSLPLSLLPLPSSPPPPNSRSVQGTSVWSAKTGHSPSRHRRDARIYWLNTAMRDNEYTPPPRLVLSHPPSLEGAGDRVLGASCVPYFFPFVLAMGDASYVKRCLLVSEGGCVTGLVVLLVLDPERAMYDPCMAKEKMFRLFFWCFCGIYMSVLFVFMVFLRDIYIVCASQRQLRNTIIGCVLRHYRLSDLLTGDRLKGPGGARNAQIAFRGILIQGEQCQKT